ncbi:MAG: RDD family protein [bacterium]|nr:RDD family protein [bacterium]
MTSQVAHVLEFRCTSCWQSVHADPQKSGQDMACPSCGNQVTIPEASPERLRDASTIAITASVVNPYSPVADARRSMSDAELMRLVEQDNRMLPTGEMDFSGYPLATLTSRFLAQLVDGLYQFAALMLGLLSVVAAAKLGFLELPNQRQAPYDLPTLFIFGFFPLVASILQWNLIATRGQSIGKLVMCIRIVNLRGTLPGFIHGVLLRNWVRHLLAAVIPFFSLIDVLFIFGESRRCVHDYLAGTRVVQA